MTSFRPSCENTIAFSRGVCHAVRVAFTRRFDMTKRIIAGGCVRRQSLGGAGAFVWCVFALLCAVLPFSCSRWSAPGPLAITHVTLIDATGSDPKPDVTVVVGDQKILSIGPSATTQIPSDAQIVDGTNKFLIPGLTDFHLHLTGAGEPTGSRDFFLPLLLANGITTVRDMGGYLQSLVPLRKEIRSGKRLGPEIFFAGPYLDGDPPSFQPSLVVTNPTQATDDVQSLVAQGVDFIKVQSILSRTAYFAIAAAAKQQHIAFVGHVPDRSHRSRSFRRGPEKHRASHRRTPRLFLRRAASHGGAIPRLS